MGVRELYALKYGIQISFETKSVLSGQKILCSKTEPFNSVLFLLNQTLRIRFG